MPDIDSLKNKYFIEPADVPASAVPPAIHDGCRVTPLVDPIAYYTALKGELSQLGTAASNEANADHFIFIVGWWPDLLGYRSPSQPFSLDGPGGERLVDILKGKAARGVDVRVLVDVGWTVMRMDELWNKHPKIRKILGLTDDKAQNIVPFVDRYEDNMETAEDLRAGGVKCCFNIICHAAGGTHMKFVVLGRPDATGSFRAVGFTGGVDFRFDRYDRAGHPIPRPYGDLQSVGWHDVVAKVEGPVLQAFYQDFQLMWNEVLTRPVKTYRAPYHDATTGTQTYRKSVTVEPNTVSVVTKSLSTEAIGAHSLQSLRTAPAA